MDALFKVTVLFTLVLALSLVIERVLEILKASFDLIDNHLNKASYWTRKTLKLKNRLEHKLRIFEYIEPEKASIIMQRFRSMLLNGQSGYSGMIPVLSADLVRVVKLKIQLKLIAIALGIFLALSLKIDLVEIWQTAAQEASLLKIRIDIPTIRMIFSGIIMGLGSGPVHKVITSLERKREKMKEIKS